MSKPSREEAMQAVKTLIEWAGDDPTREGLVETPKRVVAAYEEFFEGYTQDPEEILRKTFEEVEGYDEMVIVKDIRLESHCEHHIVPILGTAHIGYIPLDPLSHTYTNTDRIDAGACVRLCSCIPACSGCVRGVPTP